MTLRQRRSSHKAPPHRQINWPTALIVAGLATLAVWACAQVWLHV